MENNPFARLFPSDAAAKQYSEECKKDVPKEEMEVDKAPEITMPQQFMSINEKIEMFFGITLNSNTKNRAVFLSDVTTDPDQIWIDADTLEQALYERLILEDPEKHLLNAKRNRNEFVTEKRPIYYLFQCYCNIMKIIESQKEHKHKLLNSMTDLIIRYVATTLKQPQIFRQNIAEQTADLMSGGIDDSVTDRKHFLDKLVKEIIRDEEKPSTVVLNAFRPYFKFLLKRTKDSTITNFEKELVINGLLLCASNNMTADALITFTTPRIITPGYVYTKTLFGTIINLAGISKITAYQYSRLNKNESIEPSMWFALADLSKCLHDVFLALLKSSNEVKEKMLNWIEKCIFANASRGKIWAANAVIESQTVVCDGFMANLASVLLRLTDPITQDTKNKKFLKIDPTFGSTGRFSDETCLIPAEEGADRPVASDFNFITRLFFLTHKAVDLSYRVMSERYFQLAQEINRFSGTMNGLNERNNDVSSFLEPKRKECLMIKCILCEPKSFDRLVCLTSCTSEWLLQVLLDTEPVPRSTYEPKQVKEVTFPLSEHVPATFSCVPELLISNINYTLVTSHRFTKDIIWENKEKDFNSIVTLFIVLTRGNKRVKNPHVRAGIIESLESIIPKKSNYPSPLLVGHPHRKEIIPSLLDVFVSIEMTGESVDFDQKFKYRHPIYILIEFLWDSETHIQVFKDLAVEAEENIEAVDPPIFLRFLNLLINDAVYLLDEALSNMAQLRTMQQARDNGEWASLTTQERYQNEASFNRTGMIARFDNILGKLTIQSLEKLTSVIKSIFVHPTMVHRMVSMLNYFLHILVGPNTKNFKVKDMNVYEFEPGDLVYRISQIYVNLGDSDEFCTAVAQDGRSYSSTLFGKADQVLCRTGAVTVSANLLAVAERVKSMGELYKMTEEMLSDAPEEFLDPIMSTLMADPVILPTSHVTVDRTTIARHLLSDQTDPFNRVPLTLNMVQRNDELREKIHAWVSMKCKPNAASQDT